MDKRINVTKTFLPPQKEYNRILKRAWDKNWITNRGELVLELEGKLKSVLDVNNLTLSTNGTIPIQMALQLLPVASEVITTAFSYVATTSTIVWERMKPVFVDINPDFLTIDSSKIESKITKNTKAILATHVYGNPCDVSEIARIAAKHNLLVIYDAAHCFGVKYFGKSIFNYGDISTCSFHATKIFHTGEGGCWVTPDKEIHDKLFYMHKFGHDGNLKYKGVGINAKMSELQAAMGLTILPYFDKILKERKVIFSLYNEILKFKNFKRITIRQNTEWNYHYYPIIFESEALLINVEKALKEKNIFPRRYFYPSLNTLPYVDNSADVPISIAISKSVLCLPIYAGLLESEVHEISLIINSCN